MIGIGVTTYGNRACTGRTMAIIHAYSPMAKIVEVNQEGIPHAKNTCLALLEDCEHIFLFDDDCFPVSPGWHVPYVSSKENHLSFTFDRKILSTTPDHIEYEMPSGCMLYINRKCLDVIGGFDTEFKGYGYEHVNYSVRAFNAGLTSARFLDVRDSDKWIHSMDQHKEVLTTVGVPIRSKNIAPNRQRLKEQWNSKEFKAYK